MALKYDINRIFKELEQQAREKENKHKKIDETKENDPIESPEDAPQTQVVAPATSKTTEATHGGDEASKEVKDSPNSVDGGENPDKENKSNKTKNTGEHGEGKEKEPKISKNNENKENGLGTGYKRDTEKDKQDVEKKEGKNFITTDGKKSSQNKPKTTPEDLQKAVEEIFEKKKQQQEEFKTKNRKEYLKKYILEIIKKIAAQHAGIDKQEGSESYDKKQMLQHMVKQQNYKLLGDKYDLRDARYVQFFIDTSGVYGCGSNKVIQELMPKIIDILEKQGYECYIAACGNGFYERDMVEDEYYETRKNLEKYKAGKVSKIACPTPQTAARMANEAEFSVILADFDGLSSICYMANLCQKDKVPYFLCTEDRYPWKNPTLHNWVDPNLCNYKLELVYDVSMNGNPTLEQYENNQCYDDYEQVEEYKQDDDYEYAD